MKHMIEITYNQLFEDVQSLGSKIKKSGKSYGSICTGQSSETVVALLLSKELNIPMSSDISDDTLIVSAFTSNSEVLVKYTQDTAVLYQQPGTTTNPTYIGESIDGQVKLPYTQPSTNDKQAVVTQLLRTIGEDPAREGLRDTPRRVIDFYEEFLGPEPFNFTAFNSEDYDEIILQKDIPFYSICEHHMAPFFGKAAVAYIPAGKIVGLSKLARCVQHYSRRLQNQERITSQVAQRLEKELKPRGVAVVLEARHLCMEMRGVKTQGAITSTSKLLGEFQTNQAVRLEFMGLIK